MKKYGIMVILFLIGLCISAIQPHDYFTWWLEVMPAIIGLAVLSFTFKKFRFTDITYWMILAQCFVLFIGGHYTYAEVPLFDWIKELFHQERNNYDKVGHFMQGFVPAFVAREIFIRQEVITPGKWVGFLTICVCLAISACYEFLEWFVAECTGGKADAFLGTQGYVWDTQSDMLFAMIGAICMLLFFSRIQDKQMNKIMSYKL